MGVIFAESIFFLRLFVSFVSNAAIVYYVSEKYIC